MGFFVQVPGENPWVRGVKNRNVEIESLEDKGDRLAINSNVKAHSKRALDENVCEIKDFTN